MEITTKDIKSRRLTSFVTDRSMPICLTPKQYEMIEDLAKRKGMLNSSQLIEEIINEN